MHSWVQKRCLSGRCVFFYFFSIATAFTAARTNDNIPRVPRARHFSTHITTLPQFLSLFVFQFIFDFPASPCRFEDLKGPTSVLPFLCPRGRLVITALTFF